MVISLAHLVRHLGVLGVGLGAGLEGETAVVLGGVAARHGLFSPYAGAIAACVGSFLADQLFFALGRWRRNTPFVEAVAKKPAFTQGLAFIDRHPVAFCLGLRFVYGFRVAGPVALGVSHLPARLFVALNFVSAAIWATVFTWLGYHFGRLAERTMGRLVTPVHLIAVMVTIGVVVLCIAAWRRVARKGSNQNVSAQPANGPTGPVEQEKTAPWIE